MRSVPHPCRAAIVLLVAALAVAPLPARAASGPTAGQVAAAAAAADAASRQVALLLDRYRAADRQVSAAAAALAVSFGTSTAAAAASAAAADRLAAARQARGQRVRALYAAGGSLGLAASLLAAPTPDDALWRASTARRILAGVLEGDRRYVAGQQVRAADAARLAAAADAADQQRARTLGALQGQAAIATDALVQARRALAALDSTARRLKAAKEAAARIAAAEAAAAARAGALGPVGALAIPAEFERDYRAAAATCPGMSWTLLAGVGQVESGHGRNNGPSSAGAVGPMQFMPATFTLYAVDGDHDGVLDPWDPADATFTAARYLCVSGASAGTAAGIHQALLTYNHAEWYVTLVLRAQAAIIAAHPAG